MDFEVRRDDLRTHRVIDGAVPEPGAALGEGEVLLHLDHAALTANNVTYGAFGDVMGYWQFFPADDATDQWIRRLGEAPAHGVGSTTK